MASSTNSDAVMQFLESKIKKSNTKLLVKRKLHGLEE